jgi:sialidase-1
MKTLANPRRLLIGLSLLVLGPTLRAAEPVAVFTSGATIAGKIYQGVRIPALLRLADGTLLAFAEARVHGLADHGDVDLVMTRSNDQGATWSAPIVVADAAEAFVGNAAPVLDAKTGVITVLMAWKAPGAVERDIRSGKQPPCAIWSIRSTDGGTTWSAPTPTKGLEDLSTTREWRWNLPSPCHGIQLTHGPHAGRLVIAGNHSAPGGASNAFLGAHLLLSDDGGVTWRVGAVDGAPVGGRAGVVPYPNESTVAELSDGTLVVHTRNEGGPTPGTRAVALSRDGGETFVAPFTDMPFLIAPVCQGALLTGQDAAGRDVLIATMPGSPKKRERLVLRPSRDGGATWGDEQVLYPGAAAYSDVAQLAPGRYLVLAEVDGYRRIVALTANVP